LSLTDGEGREIGSRPLNGAWVKRCSTKIDEKYCREGCGYTFRTTSKMFRESRRGRREKTGGRRLASEASYGEGVGDSTKELLFLV